MKRLRFNTRGFRCPYQCGNLCKTPGGLTRHQSACPKNPANIYIRQLELPPPDSPRPASPRTPTGSPTQQAFPLTPSTPANLDNAPIHQSPRRIRWTVKGQVKFRTHPYLDGQSHTAQTLIGMASNCCFIVFRTAMRRRRI
jgi:hypothetical protein